MRSPHATDVYVRSESYAHFTAHLYHTRLGKPHTPILLCTLFWFSIFQILMFLCFPQKDLLVMFSKLNAVLTILFWRFVFSPFEQEKEEVIRDKKNSVISYDGIPMQISPLLDTKPLIVFINPKSGGRQGAR